MPEKNWKWRLISLQLPYITLKLVFSGFFDDVSLVHLAPGSPAALLWHQFVYLGSDQAPSSPNFTLPQPQYQNQALEVSWKVFLKSSSPIAQLHWWSPQLKCIPPPFNSVELLHDIVHSREILTLSSYPLKKLSSVCYIFVKWSWERYTWVNNSWEKETVGKYWITEEEIILIEEDMKIDCLWKWKGRGVKGTHGEIKEETWKLVHSRHSEIVHLYCDIYLYFTYLSVVLTRRFPFIL